MEERDVKDRPYSQGRLHVEKMLSSPPSPISASGQSVTYKQGKEKAVSHESGVCL